MCCFTLIVWLCLFLVGPLVRLRSMIVPFPVHIHVLFGPRSGLIKFRHGILPFEYKKNGFSRDKVPYYILCLDHTEHCQNQKDTTCVSEEFC